MLTVPDIVYLCSVLLFKTRMIQDNCTARSQFWLARHSGSDRVSYHTNQRWQAYSSKILVLACLLFVPLVAFFSWNLNPCFYPSIYPALPLNSSVLIIIAINQARRFWWALAVIGAIDVPITWSSIWEGWLLLLYPIFRWDRHVYA